jgi:hypothetical protein
MSYDPSEQDEIAGAFARMLKACTGDGGVKREAGLKPSWKVDPSHEAAIFSHLNKWKHGEVVDPDSGAHPLVHLAWRALAIAWQEENSVTKQSGQLVGEEEQALDPVTPTSEQVEETLARRFGRRDCNLCELGALHQVEDHADLITDPIHDDVATIRRALYRDDWGFDSATDQPGDC